MKKVGILTINDNSNMGNRLQNYATQEFLEECGVVANTIPNYARHKYYLYKIKNNIKMIIKFWVKRDKYKRDRNFIRFNKENIKFSKLWVNFKNVPKKLNKEYDFFVTGSDQVWNPNFNRMSDIDFLTFADYNKRVSFAASFGIKDIPIDLKEYYTNKLNGLNKISVREERAKEIVEELTGRKDALVILDPTMLISKEKWDKVMKKPKKMDNIVGQKYILTYFLGKLSDKRKKEIERVARENNCDIINLLNKNDPFYIYGPSEYVYLEKNALLICTDSFHSAVFSILYNRPFVLYDREDSEVKMNSRLETLLNKFGLEDRWYKGKIDEKFLSADYKIDDVLQKEREKAKKFLEEIIQ